MSLGFYVSAAARKDAADAQRYLEGLTTDAGPRFRDELERCWRYVAQYPQGFQMRYRQFRYAPLAVFRYYVIFSMDDLYGYIERLEDPEIGP